MPLLDEIRKNRAKILAIAARNKVCEVRVFGSAVRGEETQGSDVDFLITLEPEASLMDIGGFVADMERLLHRKVDAVEPESLHWVIKDRVLKEALPV